MSWHETLSLLALCSPRAIVYKSEEKAVTLTLTGSNRIVMIMRKCCLLGRICWAISGPGVCRLLTAPGAVIDCSHWIWNELPECLWQNPLLVWTQMRRMNGSVAALWRRYWPDSGQIRNEMDWFPSPAKINLTVMTSLNRRKDKIFLGITFLSLWLETLGFVCVRAFCVFYPYNLINQIMTNANLK